MLALKNIVRLFIFLLLFISCENDIKVINIVGNKEHLPVESAKNVETIYSDSAQIQMILKTPQYERYDGEKPYTEMTKGISAYFYDINMQVKSKLTANYAINYEKDKIMEARNNVVVVNEKNEQLNTEKLVWDQQKAIIYSDKYVKINTGKEILWGIGMESDERFEKWHIKNVQGSFSMEEE
ncbi:MAG TPA: LPS export ABC transporter periplasmic protein LptC [Bacteroidales bacterium]|nr:LPS export ABC transporter periplasmic protein LptC [Bacteroidales bacterium]HQH18432.1 LPS export ABC transporter periplasmic protein LptC [Bacteroidales bacterium]HQI46290.1 LPS export ABC transporter periplasmic protein LptC [Bacteroidales bacterium]